MLTFVISKKHLIFLLVILTWIMPISALAQYCVSDGAVVGGGWITQTSVSRDCWGKATCLSATPYVACDAGTTRILSGAYGCYYFLCIDGPISIQNKSNLPTLGY